MLQIPLPIDHCMIEYLSKFLLSHSLWMNGQHLRCLSSEELTKLIGEHWKSTDILTESEGLFIEEVVQLLKDGIDLMTDSDKALSNLLSYPLYATLVRSLTSEGAAPIR